MTSDPIHRLKAAGIELSARSGPSPSFDDVMGRSELPPGRSRWANVVIALCAFAISVALFIGLHGAFQHGSSPSVHAGPIAVRPVIGSSLPFVGATRTTLEGAERTVAYPVILPADGTPGLGNVQTVWVSDDPQSQIEIDYDSGISLTLDPDVPPDPQTHLQTLADAIGPAASVESVNGGPALVVVADWSTPCPNGKAGCALAEMGNPGSVEVIVSGVAATLYGHVSSDVLVSISSTLTSTSTGPAPTGATQMLSHAVGQGARDALHPPPTDIAPAISSDQAFAIAWTSEPPAEGRFDSVHATLAVRGSHRSPVWIVTYVGGCQVPIAPPMGYPGPQEYCSANVRWQVDVDAVSGAVPAAFGYVYDGSADESVLELQTTSAT